MPVNDDSGVTAEQPAARAFLSSVPPGRAEVRIAMVLLAVLGAAFVAAIPFAQMPAGRTPAFVPAYEASLIICDLITAMLLMGQFSRSRSLAVLVLGAGYFYDALMIVAHALSFPGLFSPTGLLGAGEQTTVWLYVFWHGGFPVYVLAYIMLRKRELRDGGSGAPPVKTLAFVAGLTLVLAAAFGVLAFPGQHLLPEMIRGNDHLRLLTTGVSPVVWLLSVAAFVALWRVRRRSVLDLWLTAVMGAWIMDVGLAIVIGSARFDWGFYLSRTYGLLSCTVVLVALLLEMNRLYGSLATALDIAEARNLELARSREELARAQRMEAVGQLTGGVAHDFNNLLMVVSGNVEMLLKAPELTVRSRRLADGALRAAQRGAQITEQLLTFARKQLSRPVTVDLNRLLQDFVPLLRQAVGAGVDLRLQLSSGPATVRVDTAQFESAVLNLVVNARDAMPAGGRITVETAIVTLAAGAVEGLAAGAYVVVSVEDTGEGMPPEIRARAFEPFFTTKPVGKGSGLGLSQVFGFVAGASGQVIIDTAPGQGTRLQLYLPLSADAVPEAKSSAAPQPSHEAKGVVLVVEDDPDVLALTEMRLAEMGYRVVAASDARQALRLLDGERVDLVFTDLVLPGGVSGLDLVTEVRRRCPALPILLTSGYNEEVFRTAAGEVAVLRKPYRAAELAQQVQRALAG